MAWCDLEPEQRAKHGYTRVPRTTAVQRAWIISSLLLLTLAPACGVARGDSDEEHAAERTDVAAALRASVSSSDTCAEALAGTPVPVLDFASPTRLFRHAAATSRGGHWIVSGVEMDAAASGGDMANPDFRRVRIAHETEGEIHPPPRMSKLPLELPIPVPLADSSWGLIWAEAQPVGPRPAEWLPTMYTRLWFAERAPDGWLKPRTILETGLGMSWETNRTVIADPQRGTFLMVLARESLPESHIVFGEVGSPLRRVALPGGLSPRASTFLLADSAILLVAHVISSGSASGPGALVMGRLPEADQTLSTADTIWGISEPVVNLRLHRDRDAVLHVLWNSGNSIYHIARAPHQSEWQAFQVPRSSGELAEWSSGIDQCGLLTVVAQIISPDQDFEVARWVGGWSAFEDAFPGLLGVYLFDGVGEDGSWYVGWSGDYRQREGPHRLSAWLTRP